MVVPMEKGKCYRSNKTITVRVYGFYRKAVSGENGVLVKSVGNISSGPQYVSYSLAEWEAEGFREVADPEPEMAERHAIETAKLPAKKAPAKKAARKAGRNGR